MQKVKLKYKNEQKVYEMPASFDECTSFQLTKIWNFQTRKDPALFEEMLLFVHLSGIPVEVLDEQDEYEMIGLLEHLKFAAEPLRLKKSRARKLFGWRGPGNALDGMSFEQLALADTALRSWLQTKNPKLLNLLVGVLYHPAFLPWTNRWFFCETYSWLASHLPVWLKIRLALNFKGVLEEFMSQFPHVYKKTKGKASPFGYESSFIALSATKFGDYKKTLLTPAYRIMVFLEDNAREVAAMKNKTAKNKTE